MMFSDLGSAGRNLTCETGLPCSFAAASFQCHPLAPCLPAADPAEFRSIFGLVEKLNFSSYFSE
jgi:hypothetical protein